MKYVQDVTKGSFFIAIVIGLHGLAIWQLLSHGVAATVVPDTLPKIIQVSLSQPSPKPAAVMPQPAPVVALPLPEPIPTPPPIEKVVENPRPQLPIKKVMDKPKHVRKHIEKLRHKPIMTEKPVMRPAPTFVAAATQTVSPPVPTPVQQTVSPPSPPVQTRSMPAPVATSSAPLSQPVFNAAYLNNPAPSYPLLSKRRGEQGKVKLRVHVNANGRAEKLEIATSSGYERLDQAALETVKQWRFVPAKRGEEAVGAWVIVPINFQLEG